MQPRSPALEVKMEKVSTATMTLPLVLWQMGRKVTQTLRSTSMLKVRNLASLKVSGRFLARKAKEKVPRAKEPGWPRTQEKAVTKPLLHMMRSFSGSECVHLKERGRGSQPDSTDHHLDHGAHGKDIAAPVPSSHLMVLPGFPALNARITARVLAKTVATATVNTAPNVICRRTQVAVWG